IQRTRREMDAELRRPGERPDPSLAITRRIFLHKSLLAGAAAGAATYGWFPLINTLDLAFGAETFKFAWISDNHLYPKNVNTRFVEKATRAAKGVRFVGLDTVSRGPDYWTAKKMTPKERMGHMATLDGSVAGAWAGVGRDQLEWLNRTLSNWPKAKPVVIFSHNPLYEYYPPWNFWVRDWREVHEVLKSYTNVTNVHGHTHQVLYNEVGKLRSIGMLATSWTWPYPPEGVPALTKCAVRVDPGDHFDGVGWARLTVTAAE